MSGGADRCGVAPVEQVGAQLGRIGELQAFAPRRRRQMNLVTAEHAAILENADERTVECLSAGGGGVAGERGSGLGEAHAFDACAGSGVSIASGRASPTDDIRARRTSSSSSHRSSWPWPPRSQLASSAE